MDDDGLSDLLAIFDITRKSELKAHCRRTVLTRSALVKLIIACGTYSIPMVHIARHRHHHPQHLWPSDEEHAAFARHGPGVISGGGASKFIRKIGQLTEERRLFNAHLFVPVYNRGEWHLFYFDQRDTAGDHWPTGGSHLHLMNMLTHPKLTLERLDLELRKARPHFSGGLHVRFRRHD